MIGWTRLHLMEFSEAEEDGLASVQMAKEVSHPRAHLLGIMLVGEVSCDTGQLEKADHFLQQALELAQSIHADNFLANTLQILAQNSLARGDKTKAQAYAIKGIEIARKVGMTFIGPALLAIKAASSDDEAVAQEALKKAEAILDSGVFHTIISGLPASLSAMPCGRKHGTRSNVTRRDFKAIHVGNRYLGQTLSSPRGGCWLPGGAAKEARHSSMN